MIEVKVTDAGGKPVGLSIDSAGYAKVAVQQAPAPPEGTLSKYRFFSQLVSSDGDGTGTTNMNVSPSLVGTNGACADHTGPTYTFTSASALFVGAQSITITDTGDTAHAIVGTYKIVSVNSATSVELERDPTDGTNETGINYTHNTAYFTIDSVSGYDINIMKILIYIEDSTVSHATFGALAALSTGIDISVFENGQETFLVEKGKKFADLIQQTVLAAPFGDSVTSFELASVTGTADAQALPMDLGALIPGGIRLVRGTKDKLRVAVYDDLNGIDFFTVRVMGYRNYP